MQDKRDAGQERWMQDRRMQDKRDAGHENSGQVGCRKGESNHSIVRGDCG